jgi:hypothetical protein
MKTKMNTYSCFGQLPAAEEKSQFSLSIISPEKTIIVSVFTFYVQRYILMVFSFDYTVVMSVTTIIFVKDL